MAIEEGRTMKLLSLDGGGIRGLSSLYILQNIMHKIKDKERLKIEPLPCNCFDMICGTSTGGIIAIMLGRLRMSVSECIEAYLKMSKEVFGKRQSFLKREKFAAEALEKVIRKIVGEVTGQEDAPLMSESDCNTFVCTFCKEVLAESPALLRTYETGSPPIKCAIWEAARATSAAPTFFSSIEFQEHPGCEFIDAGVGCNNPTKVLIEEAEKFLRSKNYIVTRPTCVVSIGTGKMSPVQLRKAPWILWLKDRLGLTIAPVLRDIVTDCERIHDEVYEKCNKEKMSDRYFRFNVSQGLENIELDEWKKTGAIRAHTEGYMRQDQTQDDLSRCVDLLLPTHDQRPAGAVPEQRPVQLGKPGLSITQGGSKIENNVLHAKGKSSVQALGNVVGLGHGNPLG